MTHSHQIVIVSIAILAACGDAAQTHARGEDVQAPRSGTRDADAAVVVDASTASPSASVANRPPVAYVLWLGRARYDVNGDPITLEDGRRITVAPAALWTYSSRRLSLRHDPAIHVIDTATGIKLASLDATAEVAIVSSELDTAAGLAFMEELIRQSAPVQSRSSSTFELLGGVVPATHLETTGPAVELVVAPAGHHRQLRIVITSAPGSPDIGALRTALSSIVLGALPVTPQFVVAIDSSSGSRIAENNIAANRSFALDGLRMKIVKRSTVLEQIDGLRFEHSPELAVRYGSGSPRPVALFTGSISIFAVAFPDAVATEDLAARLGLQLRYPQMTTRVVGDELLASVEGYVSSEAVSLQVAAYSFDRDGRHLAVSVMAPIGTMDDAKKLSELILKTLR